MKISIAQQNYTSGNITKNCKKIITHIQQAKHKNCELAIFSELSICGTLPYDLLLRNDFIVQCNEALHEIARECVGITAIVGCPVEENGELYNSAVYLRNGKIEQYFYKNTIDWDEQLYFNENPELKYLQINNESFAVIFTNDIEKPQVKHHCHNADYVIILASQAFCGNNEIYNRLSKFAQEISTPIMYVNSVGGEVSEVFEGASAVVSENGKVVEQLPYFEEESKIIDLPCKDVARSVSTLQFNKIALTHNALIVALKDFFAKRNFTTATLGLSGGLDSAVVLALAVQALGSENIRVFLLPSEFSSQHSIDDAVALAKTLHVRYDTLSIAPLYNTALQTLQPVFADLPFGLAEENLQSRLRGVLLMAASNKFGNIVLNTSNKSEAAVGYGTLYGDTNGAISILSDVYKTDVYRLAQYINRNGEIIPQNTITKAPSAELRPGQKDSDSLPDYAVLDAILYEYFENNQSQSEIIQKGFSPDVVEKTLRLVRMNEYKRFQFPPVVSVSTHAFTAKRRMPL
ncbi:MAG: NAD+ synthase [Bacteroidales bacterium]|jgi:NAD+ synthase (glutamine-hydrolysing)|nr:NAD+ synthase [Bacteroidales bacterium]